MEFKIVSMGRWGIYVNPMLTTQLQSKIPDSIETYHQSLLTNYFSNHAMAEEIAFFESIGIDPIKPFSMSIDVMSASGDMQATLTFLAVGCVSYMPKNFYEKKGEVIQIDVTKDPLIGNMIVLARNAFEEDVDHQDKTRVTLDVQVLLPKVVNELAEEDFGELQDVFNSLIDSTSPKLTKLQRQSILLDMDHYFLTQQIDYSIQSRIATWEFIYDWIKLFIFKSFQTLSTYKHAFSTRPTSLTFRNMLHFGYSYHRQQDMATIALDFQDDQPGYVYIEKAKLLFLVPKIKSLNLEEIPVTTDVILCSKDGSWSYIFCKDESKKYGPYFVRRINE